MHFMLYLASRISVSCGRPLVKPKGHIHHHLKEHKYHLQYLLLSLFLFFHIFTYQKLSSKINHLYDHVKYNNNSPNEPVQSLSFCCRMMPTASLHKKTFQLKIGRGWLNYFIMIFCADTSINYKIEISLCYLKNQCLVCVSWYKMNSYFFT